MSDVTLKRQCTIIYSLNMSFEFSPKEVPYCKLQKSGLVFTQRINIIH